MPWAVLLLAGLTLASCRAENPGFRGALQLGDADPSLRDSERETSSDEDSPATNGDSPGSGLADTSATKLSDASQSAAVGSTSGESSGQTPNEAKPNLQGPVCDAPSLLCFSMKSDGTSTAYPDAVRSDATLVIDDSNQPVSHSPGGDDSLFSSYVLFPGQGYLKLKGTGGGEDGGIVSVGEDRDYGFDLSIRRLSCAEKSLCYIGRAGDLVLMVDVAENKMGCAFVRSDNNLGDFFMPVDLTAINTAGCATDGHNLQLFVNGQSAWNLNATVVHAYTHVPLGLGNIKSSRSGKMTGEVGRYRYWRDIKAMATALTP